MSINPILTPSRIIPPMDGKFRWVLQDLGNKDMQHNVARYIDGEWVTRCGNVIAVSLWLDDGLMRAACEVSE